MLYMLFIFPLESRIIIIGWKDAILPPRLNGKMRLTAVFFALFSPHLSINMIPTLNSWKDDL